MKTLKELTLLSKFLFDQTMDQPEAHEAALRIILNDDNLKLLLPSQTEKELRTAPWLRSIRLDVFALDEYQTVYDTEMQGEYRKDLIKRSRYYQGLIDSSLLEPGSVDFNALNNTYIIMIMPFDMQTWEEKILDRERGRQEGLECGIRALIESCMEFGISKEDILVKLQKNFL